MTDEQHRSIEVRVLLEDRTFDVRLRLVAGASGLERTLSHPRVQKAGLALAGFLQSIRPHRMQVFGKTELEYLATLDGETRLSSVEHFFQCDVACAAVTAGADVPGELVEAAEANKRPLFVTPHDSSMFINRVQELLDDALSPDETVHGVMIDVFGIGVLLVGPSGIGKSECALDLILRGHRLISDDAVRLTRRKSSVIARSTTITKNHMEVRGLGIMNVTDLFGAASVRDQKRVELVVEMIDGEKDHDVERLGLDDRTTKVLDTDVAKVCIPVRPGRNVSSIVEVAARNHLLKIRGHHGARRFKEMLESHLGTEPRA